MTTGIALALGVVWTAGPALAQQTTGEKLEDKSRKAGDKMERAADKTGDKLHKAADKTESKVDSTGDKAESKMDKAKDKVENAWDKTKDKTREMKDKVKAKTTDKMHSKSENADVKSMQMALKDKGFDPGPADGVMGPRTKAALMDYQRKEGLTPTGRWDDQTATKLGIRTSSMTTPSSDPAASVGTTGVPPAAPDDKTVPGEKPRRPASP
jgi:peptidoglycan hydrolase-like protein with peptidoglycan-binding domain